MNHFWLHFDQRLQPWSPPWLLEAAKVVEACRPGPWTAGNLSGADASEWLGMVQNGG